VARPSQLAHGGRRARVDRKLRPLAPRHLDEQQRVEQHVAQLIRQLIGLLTGLGLAPAPTRRLLHLEQLRSRVAHHVGRVLRARPRALRAQPGDEACELSQRRFSIKRRVFKTELLRRRKH